MAGASCRATYGVSGDRISIVATSDPENWECPRDVLGTELANAVWDLADDQLHMSDFVENVNGFVAVWLGTKPLTRLDGPASAADEVSLDGTYTWTLTAENALAGGPPEDHTEAALATYPSMFTMTLDDGGWALEVLWDGDRLDREGPGTYTIDGDRLTFDWPSARLVLAFTFSVDDSGNLDLTPDPDMPEGDAFVWSYTTWTKADK